MGKDPARAQLDQAVSEGRFYVPAASGGPSTWQLYTDGEVGFAFEYPQSYDKEPVKSWGCSVFRQSLEGGSTQVTFASRAEP